MNSKKSKGNNKLRILKIKIPVTINKKLRVKIYFA
jgi:hypothetical protein